MIGKIYDLHRLRFEDISFGHLVEPEDLLRNYANSQQLFEVMYPKLQKHTNMENIFKIEKYVEKICESTLCRSMIQWDFLMKLPEIIKSGLDDKEHLLKQIKLGCLPKI